MWVRSQFADDAWEFAPRVVAGPDAGRWSSTAGEWTGWRLRRAFGSMRGRLVFVEYEQPTWTHTPPVETGYVPPTLVPAAMASGSHNVLRTDRGAVRGQLPGVAEWASSPRQRREIGRRRYFSASWLLLAFPFAISPAVRIWQWSKRRRGTAGFQVVQQASATKAVVPAATPS